MEFVTWRSLSGDRYVETVGWRSLGGDRWVEIVTWRSLRRDRWEEIVGRRSLGEIVGRRSLGEIVGRRSLGGDRWMEIIGCMSTKYTHETNVVAVSRIRQHNNLAHILKGRDHGNRFSICILYVICIQICLVFSVT